jgi:hypothetical protein
MDNERVEFRAGRDPEGFNVWVAGSIIGRDQRDDGVWLNVLPTNSESEEDARWVHPENVRRSRA